MRTIYRGTTVKFQHAFPNLVPLKAYPIYSIYDINNMCIESGVLVSIGNFTYEVEWSPSVDLPISNETNYRIEYILKDENNKEYEHGEEFSLLDDVSAEDNYSEVKQVAMAGNEFLARLVLEKPVYQVRASLLNLMTENELWNCNNTDPEKRVGNKTTYDYKIPANCMPEGKLVLKWTIQDASNSVPRFQIQQVASASIRKIAMVDDIRILIDSFQKSLKFNKGYDVSRLIESIDHGAMFIDSMHPATSWSTLNTKVSPLFKDPLYHYVVFAAAWHALTGQHLVEVDSKFDFQGLSTTLSADRAAEIESAIGRFLDHVRTDVKPIKMRIFRSCNSFGLAGVKATSRRANYENITLKFGQTGMTSLQYFGSLGIVL